MFFIQPHFFQICIFSTLHNAEYTTGAQKVIKLRITNLEKKLIPHLDNWRQSVKQIKSWEQENILIDLSNC